MKRALAIAFTSFAVVLGAAACVDLFHSTEFDTLCTRDPAACDPDAQGSNKTDADGDRPDTGTGVVDFCSYTPETAREKAAQACAWIGHCLGSRENSSYADCYVRALLAYDCDFNPSLRPRGESLELWDCLSKVDSCESVNACAGTPASRCETSGGSGSFTACNTKIGGVAVVGCGGSEKPIGMEPCALRGQKCTTVDSYTAVCTGKLANECEEATAPKCSGTFAVRCKNVGGIRADKGTDCALVGGGECYASDAGAACTPSPGATPCERDSSQVTCNGTTAESCVNKELIQINCRSLGQSCITDDPSTVDPVSACAKLGSSCTTTGDSCTGTTLKSCRAGTTFNVDCSGVPGMKTCTPPSGDRWAACSPE